MSDIPEMTLSVEKQEWLDEAEEWFGTWIGSGEVELLAEDFGACFDAGAAAERARILALIAEAVGDADSELADRLTDVFNAGATHASIAERHKQWARALADEIEKETPR